MQPKEKLNLNKALLKRTVMMRGHCEGRGCRRMTPRKMSRSGGVEENEKECLLDFEAAIVTGNCE